MLAKELKNWVNSLPDDAVIHVLSSIIMSIPLSDPVFLAIGSETLTSPAPGMLAGKVISSFPSEDNSGEKIR